MKRAFLILLLALPATSAKSEGDGRCSPRWYIGQTIVEGSDTRASFTTYIDTVVMAGESIWITVSSQLLCTGDCSLDYPESFTWIHNGDTVSSTNYLVEDTGIYTGTIKYSSCGVSGTYRVYLKVRQAISAEENTEDNSNGNIEFYPTVSSGVYNIKSTNELAKVQIRNSAGNLVFTSGHHISSVNIMHLPEGVYFYYVEDKTRHVQRGKLVKR